MAVYLKVIKIGLLLNGDGMVLELGMLDSCVACYNS